MGEVYRATDTKLGREVALKILPEAFAPDADRMARFQREAQVLASLNHPNIASIYGLEDSGGVRALVMELVEGPTLAERIATLAPGRPQGSPLPLDEALGIATRIDEAFEYAHERGIIHRDLKPANVKVTPEGAVKVLDFGLAKALESEHPTGDIANSPTLTAAATQAGVILGTAAYMPPEQAKGRSVDRRADIWAFGCVLYEMLTGQPTFQGETVSDTLAAVIKDEPNWRRVPATTPSSIVTLVRRCLVKDPKQRLRDMGEARIAIEATLARDVAADGYREAHEIKEGAHPAPLRVLPWVLAGLMLIAGLVAGWWSGRQTTGASPQWSGDLLPGPEIAFWPRISPDGHLIAFQAIVANLSQVAVVDPESGNWTVLTHDRTRGLVQDLSWSPDGSKIYYDRYNPLPNGIYSVPALGGDERLVLANAAGPRPLADGSVLVIRLDSEGKTQIYHYWPDSGRLQGLHAYLSSIPTFRIVPGGGKAVIYGLVKNGGAGNSSNLYVLDINTGSSQLLAPDLPNGKSTEPYALAITPDGRSVISEYRSGDLLRVVAIPLSGKGRVQTLLTLTSASYGMDVGPDGSIYLDEVDRPDQILRFPQSGGTPDILFSGESSFLTGRFPPVESADGQVLIATRISGRPRLLLGKPGGSFVSLLETNEETSPPLAGVGSDEAAFMVGTPPAQSVALASLKDGQILHRFNATKGKTISAVAASPDGKTLYYVSEGSVWVTRDQDAEPHRICAGFSVAADPNGRDLIVESYGLGNMSLERVPLSGGPPQPIQLRKEIPLSPRPLGPNALSADGKLVVSVQPSDSWYFRPAIVDIATGRLTQIPLNYDGDINLLSWGPDGRILASSLPMLSNIWRFRPSASGGN
jgi:eukaryotic-like serine/threonine-protein kinase